MNRLEDAINNCAQKIAGFHLNNSIGIPKAIERIENWLTNFSEFAGLDELLIRTLDSITFLSDDQISNSVIGYIEKYLKTDPSKFYYTSFGNKKDSSFRITARLGSRYNNYSPFLPELLDEIKANQPINPTIIFIDDYLNSGGQFTRIVTEWLESDFLSQDQLQTLKNCQLCFMFYYGLNKGLNKAESVIKQFNIDAKVHIFEKYSDERGIFGNLNEVETIKKGLPLAKTSDSIFVNFNEKLVQEFYEIISQAGLELIKLYKPNKANFAERVLGYGNSAKLIIGEYNVPTCTISCLWLGGKITVKGKEIDWQPLLPRMEKITNTPETGNLSSSNDSNVFKQTVLSMNSNSGEPFDIRITVKLEKAVSQCSNFSYNPKFTFDKIRDELQKILGIGGNKPETFILSIDDDKLTALNNAFSGITINGVNNKLLSIQLKNIDLICFGKQESYFSIRIGFKQLSLEEALQINYLIAKSKNLQVSFAFNNQNCNSTDNFLNILLEELGCSSKFIQPLLLSSYLRIDKSDYQNNFFRNQIAAIIGAKLNPDNEIVKKEFIQIDAENYKTLYTANKSCCCCVCQSGLEYNDSWLQNHFQSRFFIMFMMIHHLESMKLKLAGKGKKSLFSIKSASEKWLERLSVIETTEPCVPDSIYLNRFHDAVKNSFK